MITTALLMGFAGSLHCAGMCSPLAMAVGHLTPAATLNRLVYNAGRITTYGVLGLIAGTAGSVLRLSPYQNFLSAVLGLALLAVALGLSGIRPAVLTRLFARVTMRIKLVFASFIQRKTYSSMFTLGALNGMLPCGLTFIAITYSAAIGSPLKGMYHMLLFGIGTLPVMLGFTTMIHALVRRFNLNIKKVSTAMLFLSACVLIARAFMFNHSPLSPEERQVVDIILCR